MNRFSTASVVTVADNSMENVSVSVNSSIVDIAGNPLIEDVDDSQTVDTVNPSTWALLKEWCCSDLTARPTPLALKAGSGLATVTFVGGAHS